MAEFNQISVNSSLTVVPATFASLCFNDNLLISKNKYSVTNNILNLFIDTTDTISIFSNNGIANVFEFRDIRLNRAGVTLPNTDVNEQQVEGLTKNRVLVFVNGELQPTSTYTVVDPNTLKFNISYTNDYNKLFNVIVYSSNTVFQRITYDPTYFKQKYDLAIATGKDAEAENLKQNIIGLSLTYEYKNTLLFINEHKIPFNAINVTNNTNTEIQLNIPESILTDIRSFEIIKFTDTSTNSINFTTKQGYLTYGPYDDLGRKIPDTYDVIFKLDDQAKILIDNIRPGFIVKEKNGYGEAIIVNTTFESTELQALTLQPFPYSSYSRDGYYLKVPEATSIIKYLAEFDKKYTFLPEILGIFQRLLLDEINDTVERLREARSISRVDSVQINKLISLLGFNINIKQLNKKQRRELIEELNEFYRIVGTRNSYNLVNILQNNLKLISADQLFTPSGLSKRKGSVYNYTIEIAEDEHGDKQGGSGYAVKDALLLQDSGGLIARVDEVDGNGAITALSLETSEGYTEINDNFTMKSILNGTFNVNSTANTYAYTWDISDSANCEVNTLLYSNEKKYGIKVTGVNADNEITSYDIIRAPHDVNEGKTRVDFNKIRLYRMVDNFTATISQELLEDPEVDDYYKTHGEKICEYTTGGESFTEILQPGIYYIRIAGGGGAGGAGDTKHGNSHDIYATDGSNGELKTTTFTITKTSKITGKVGQGGGEVKARGHDAQPWNITTKGNGFHNGEFGKLLHIPKGNMAGGQGGGSSGIKNEDGEVIVEARGGNGGYAGNSDGSWYYTPGGKGGGGGVEAGQGGEGGGRAWGGDFWSKPGSDGWIEIYKMPLKYSLSINGDISTADDGEIWRTIESGLEDDQGNKTEFTIVTHKEGDVVTFEFTPQTGIVGCAGTYSLESATTEAIAKLSISSTVSLWDYFVKLNADTTHISKNSTFINSDSAPDKQFTFIVAKDNSTEGTWTPTQGTEKIIFEHEPAYTRQGQGAIVVITSALNTQKNEDRCYIDFYKKEELGAEPILEFRSNAIEYGTITEGTPNSPKFWEVGLPDIEYGRITTDPPTDFITYGEISENTEGEWVEWWKWDREKNWYPTNHVDLEMKLPPGVNFSEYINTFIEQFYNLASTVVFIHQITESFYFGNDTNTNYNNPVVSPDNDIVGDPGAMISPFGIVSTMPSLEYEAVVTSDPSKQYINPIADYFDVTIIPQVPNATVKVITENVSNNGEIITTVVVLTEADNWTTRVKYNTTITYEVEAPNYITKAVTLTITKNIVRYVMLAKEIETEPKYCKLTLATNPANADVTFTTNNVTTTQSHTIYAWEGNTIKYTVAYPGYVMQTGTVVITDDTDLTINLDKAVFYTVKTTPIDANVTFTINGQEYDAIKTLYLHYDENLSLEESDPNYLKYTLEIDKSICAPINQGFSYKVYKEGYQTKTITTSVTEDKTVMVELEKIN